MKRTKCWCRRALAHRHAAAAQNRVQRLDAQGQQRSVHLLGRRPGRRRNPSAARSSRSHCRRCLVARKILRRCGSERTAKALNQVAGDIPPRNAHAWGRVASLDLRRSTTHRRRPRFKGHLKRDDHPGDAALRLVDPTFLFFFGEIATSSDVRSPPARRAAADPTFRTPCASTSDARWRGGCSTYSTPGGSLWRIQQGGLRRRSRPLTSIPSGGCPVSNAPPLVDSNALAV